MAELRYEVMVHDGLPRHREQRLPDGSPIVSSPVASTLIFGDRDAVLVDPPFTRDQVQRVGDWIENSGKKLTYVYATHGHGDHWFGTDLLLQRFPGVIAYATEGTIAKMHEQATTGRAQMWDVDFPGQIPPSPVVYQPVPSPTDSNWRASACLPSRSATPTPTTPPFCMCRPSDWWWPAMSPTTACTNTCWKAPTAESRHGCMRSTRSQRYIPAQWWPGTRTRTCPTTPSSSARLATTCWTHNDCSQANPARVNFSTT